MKAKIKMSLFSTPNRSTPKRGVGRSKEDVDRFVDRIQESEVVTESFRKRGGCQNIAPDFVMNLCSTCF